MWTGTAYIAKGMAIFIDTIELPVLTDWGKVMIIGGVSLILIRILGIGFYYYR